MKKRARKRLEEAQKRHSPSRVILDLIRKNIEYAIANSEPECFVCKGDKIFIDRVKVEMVRTQIGASA